MEGADAGYLYIETPSQHMHTLKIAVLEPHDDLSFDSFQGGVLARLDKLPPLRRGWSRCRSSSTTRCG